MTTEQLSVLVLTTLEDHKAQEVVALDVRKYADFTNVMVFASATSGRHVKALADYLVEEAKQAGAPILGVEGLETNEWVLVDLVDVIVHIMQPATREYYRLEDLWGALKPAAAG